MQSCPKPFDDLKRAQPDHNVKEYKGLEREAVKALLFKYINSI
jgi:hypothetical protein